MSAYNDLTTKIAGLKYGVDYERVSSWRAAEDIDYGQPVFGYAGDDVNCYQAKRDTSTITLDADLVASNVFTITLNGTDVAVTYAVSHDNTMDLAIAALEAEFPNATFDLTDATDNRQITAFWKGTNLTVAGAVTLGGSQASVTIGYTTAQYFLGVALFTQKSNADDVGYYKTEEAVNVLEHGWIHVNASKAVNSGTPAYAIWTITDQGDFTDASSDNYDTGCRFRETITEAGLVLVEVNGQATDATP